jgi:hypothetical protein
LKLKYDEPLSYFASNFNLCRYNAVAGMIVGGGGMATEVVAPAVNCFKAGAYTRPLFGFT